MNRSASASLSTPTFSMNDILNKSTVLVLNRHWQAIHEKTPAEASAARAVGPERSRRGAHALAHDELAIGIHHRGGGGE